MKQEKLVPELRFEPFSENFDRIMLSKKAKINKSTGEIPSSFI